jgi:hypothetical protein
LSPGKFNAIYSTLSVALMFRFPRKATFLLIPRKKLQVIGIETDANTAIMSAQIPELTYDDPSQIWQSVFGEFFIKAGQAYEQLLALPKCASSQGHASFWDEPFGQYMRSAANEHWSLLQQTQELSHVNAKLEQRAKNAELDLEEQKVKHAAELVEVTKSYSLNSQNALYTQETSQEKYTAHKRIYSGDSSYEDSVKSSWSHDYADEQSDGVWKKEDDVILRVARQKGLSWEEVHQQHFPGKSKNACRQRHGRLVRKKNSDDEQRHEQLAIAYQVIRTYIPFTHIEKEVSCIIVLISKSLTYIGFRI